MFFVVISFILKIRLVRDLLKLPSALKHYLKEK
ncbi:alpha-2,3-sialyltransferase [Pasteurella multocida]